MITSLRLGNNTSAKKIQGRKLELHLNWVLALLQRQMSVLSTDGQRVTSRVEDPFIKREDAVIGEGQVEVLQSGAEENGRLIIFTFINFSDVLKAGKAAALRLGVPFQRSGHFPGCLTVLRIFGGAPENEVRLGQLGTVLRGEKKFKKGLIYRKFFFH